jgi:7,8-dihydro-6-hydroxymethylpterin-pyrophosphokinase
VVKKKFCQQAQVLTVDLVYIAIHLNKQRHFISISHYYVHSRSFILDTICELGLITAREERKMKTARGGDNCPTAP